MKKILTIAAREYRAMVATKAFVLSLVMMPLLMFGGILAIKAMEKFQSSETLTIAVWDESGNYLPLLEAAAQERNQSLLNQPADPSQTELTPSSQNKEDPLPDVDRFQIQVVDQPIDDALRLSLSDQIRSKELHAFVEIPAAVSQVGSESGDDAAVRFYSEGSELDSARRWIGSTLNELVKLKRLQDLGIDSQVVTQASLPLTFKTMKPVQQQSDGAITAEESKDTMTALLLPMGMMLMMFMVIMLAAQPMLESVLEEKSQRIAEVLLGSCNPMQLMSGKLLGTVAGSLTIFLVYMTGGLLFAAKQNYMADIPLNILPWFFLYQVCGVLFYSAIFMAVGSSVSQLKEAQSMMIPIWLMLVLPLMTWLILVRKPDGTLALAMSLFPPTTPAVMVLRLSTGTTVPIWQVLLSLTLLIAATAFCVYLAGRIFRIGILWQGKAPRLTQLLGWAIKG